MDLVEDLRRSLRGLVRTPSFTLVAVLTLALGIGANTAIFTVVDAVLLTELPYPEPERLVQLWHVRDSEGEKEVTSPGNYYDWAGASSFSAMAGYGSGIRTVTGHGPAREVAAVRVAGPVFDVLDISPARGRGLLPADDAPGADPVIVVAHSFGRELFGDEDPLGRSVTLDGTSFTIVGVMPPDFGFPDSSVAGWFPARFDADLRNSRTERFLHVIGRLAPGMGLAGARAEMTTIGARLESEHPQANADLSIVLVPLGEELVAGVRTPLWVLMGAVVAVLLIACVNLANLMLARTSGREREIAVMKALGAGRLRVARRVLADGVVLAALGAAAGVLIAFGLLDALLALLPLELPRAETIAVDGGVLTFTAVTAILAGLLFTLLPAIRASGRPAAIRLGERGGDTRGWTRRSLVVAEVLMAVVLLSGAALMVRSFDALRSVDPGFETGGRLTLRVSAAAYPVPERPAFFRELNHRIEGLAGVTASSYTTALPAVEAGPTAWLNLPDRPAPEGEPPAEEYRVVGPDLPAVAGIPLLRGRLPDHESSRSRSPEVVIDEVLAARYWPDRDPIGSRLTLGPGGGWIPPSTVVGVVGAVQDEALGRGAPGMVYLPHALTPWWSSMAYVIRTEGDPLALVPAIRREVESLSQDAPLTAVQTLEAAVAGSIATERSIAILLSMMAALALTLAAIGLFGVLSYAVARRTRELGIRAALGAGPATLRSMVMRQGMGLVLTGLIPGVLLALALSGILESLLFEVPPHDPLAYLIAAATLLATAALATWWPARRATRVDPAATLRSD